MKAPKLSFRSRTVTSSVPDVLALALAQAHAQNPVTDLGTASSFAVLAGSAITNTGATTIYGDVGSFPTATITGFETVILYGVNHGGDTVTQDAKDDLSASYNTLLLLPADYNLLAGAQLTGSPLPGVYNAPTSIGITGLLTLDAAGDPDAFWVFQMGSTLTTASDSSILLVGGASAENVFWQVGSSATLGTGSSFAGNILASDSITATTGAIIEGRLLALNAAVTLQGNVISVPEPASSMILGISLGFLLCKRRRIG